MVDMTHKDFKHWLIDNDLTQKQVAEKLGITDRTISVYNNNQRYPKQFQYALIGLAKTLND